MVKELEISTKEVALTYGLGQLPPSCCHVLHENLSLALSDSEQRGH